MKYELHFRDYNHQLLVCAALLGRRQAIAIHVRRGKLPPSRRLVRIKERLKSSFPWVYAKKMSFGKHSR